MIHAEFYFDRETGQEISPGEYDICVAFYGEDEVRKRVHVLTLPRGDNDETPTDMGRAADTRADSA